MKTIVNAAGLMFNAKVEYEVISEVPSVYTDPKMLSEVKEYLSDLGELRLADDDYALIPSDDMAYVSEKVPTVYLLLGARVEGNPYGHHNPRVLFDEKALPWGAAMHAQCAFEWLKNHK